MNAWLSEHGHANFRKGILKCYNDCSCTCTILLSILCTLSNSDINVPVVQSGLLNLIVILVKYIKRYLQNIHHQCLLNK